MAHYGHPILHAILILGGAFGFTQAYIFAAAFVNWPPFFYYPSFGSPAYLTVYIIFAATFAGIDIIAHRGADEGNKQKLKAIGKIAGS